jgi:hypothetical protein
MAFDQTWTAGTLYSTTSLSINKILYTICEQSIYLTVILQCFIEILSAAKSIESVVDLYGGHPAVSLTK